MASRKGANKRYPNGTQPLCEAATGTIKSTLFLSDAAYRAAYGQFQDICLEREIRQKQGTDKAVWQGAVDALIRHNTDIHNAINVVPGTPTQLQDRRTVLNTLCRQSSKNLRARGGTPIARPLSARGPATARALSSPPAAQPAPALLRPLDHQHARDFQHVLGHQPLRTLSVGLLHDTSIENQLAAGSEHRSGAPYYTPYHHAAGDQQYPPVPETTHLLAVSSSQTFQPHPHPHQVLAQSALVLEDAHDVEEMQAHHEIPVDPVLLAHDAAMRQQAAGRVPRRGRRVETGGNRTMDVGRMEEM